MFIPGSSQRVIKEITEDDERRSLDDLQKLTNATVAEVDKLVSAKEAEIMAV